ncbi:MAG TPA: glutamine-hydrolyzing GMP synthase [Candidatus Paceibacterota bacterium]|nr:glutamine-hydrolyzing GMP synthase [Candidatus Paceibacterota bacterium]
MIVVLNFGSQFAHLIARRIRDLGVQAEILPFNASLSQIQALNPKGIIFSGGPASVLEKASPRPQEGIFKLGLPILGICYGHQVIAKMLGGKVEKGKHREFGREELSIKSGKDVFEKLGKKETVWFSHGDQVTRLPKGFVTSASTKGCAIAGYKNEKSKMYAIQFHPEVTHTKNGKKIIENFIFKICKAKKDWQMSSVAEKTIKELREKIGKDHVILGISGGVDSLVAATLLHKAIGNQLHAVFVDTGLLRKNEVTEVAASLKARNFKNLYTADAASVFLTKLKGITDPEEKRKIIGHTFIEIFEREIKTKLSKHPIKYFAQGTIYPDRIESAGVGGTASKIKSHHNLTLPEKFGLEVIEPLRDFYKDEVRKIGELLKIPKSLVWRHPFPGPGLAIRIVGEITEDRLRILREADSVYIEELKKAGEYEKIWQAFAVLLPIKSVGVMGDARTYEYMLALRAVDSIDGMSADWHKIPTELLERISSKIVGTVRGVNRVLYDITQKPPATIEYE